MAKALQGIVGLALVVYGTATGNVGLAQFGYSLIVSNVLTVAAQALVGKPKQRRLGQEIEYSGTVEPRRILYGFNRVSGMNCIGAWTSGDQRKYLHQVLAVAGHEVTDIGDVYFGEYQIADANITAIGSPGSYSDGIVTSGDYADKAWIRRYLGTATQEADWILGQEFAGGWDSNRRGRGIAYVAMMFEFDQTVYPSGKPEPIRFDIQGKKVYDPRLDTSPGANPTNASYIAYSTNPALCAADYFTDSVVGLGVDATRIDWDTVVAAANICDEDVSVPSGGSPDTTTQKRYTCNVVLYAALSDEERRSNIETLMSAMLGHVTYRGGKYCFYAGAAGSSSFAITEDDVVGKVSLRTEIPSSEKYNFVRGQFVDPNRDYTLGEFTPVSNSTYETEDGERKPREVVFAATTNQYEAQRKAFTVLKRSRLKRQATIELGMSAFKIRPWDVGTVTLADLGWNEQLVRCMSWNMNPEGTVECTFLEEDPDVWDEPLAVDYGQGDWGDAPGDAYFTPAAPTSLTALTTIGGVILYWNIPAGNPSTTVYDIYSYTSSTPFSSATRVVEGVSASTVTVPTGDSTTRYYWVVARDRLSGNESDEYPSGAGVSGAGSVGASGGSSVDVIFRRSATQPATPDGSTSSPFDGPPPDWYTDVDSATETSPWTPLWSSFGTRPNSLSTWTWQTPVKVEGTDGDPGAAGLSVAELTIYQRAASPPSTPTGGSYNFGTLTLTPPSGWSVAVPAGTDPCYISKGVASVQGTTGTDSTITWSSPVVAFQNGADGTGNTEFYTGAASVTGSDSGAATSGTVQSSNTSVTTYNGTPTYTYVWTHLYTESGNTPTCSNTSASNPYFSATVEDGTNSVSYWRVLTTDSSSPQQVAASDIRVRLTWVNTS